MPNNEELAEGVKAQQAQLSEIEKAKGKNYMLPKPPQPGEYIYCKVCGKVMMPM